MEWDQIVSEVISELKNSKEMPKASTIIIIKRSERKGAKEKEKRKGGLKQTNRQTEKQNIIIIHCSPYVTLRISFFFYL